MQLDGRCFGYRDCLDVLHVKQRLVQSTNYYAVLDVVVTACKDLCHLCELLDHEEPLLVGMMGWLQENLFHHYTTNTESKNKIKKL